MSSNVAIANRHFHSVQGFSSQPRSITVPEGEKTINDNIHSKKGIIDNISNDHILNHTDELDSSILHNGNIHLLFSDGLKPGCRPCLDPSEVAAVAAVAPGSAGKTKTEPWTQP